MLTTMEDDYANAVYEFHITYGSPVNEGLPHFPEDISLRSLRTNLIIEELGELLIADEAHDIVEVADALGDLLYVIHGMAITYGIPLYEVFQEIHRSNMSKLDVDGLPIYREDGKVLKGPSYSPPALLDILYPPVRNEGMSH